MKELALKTLLRTRKRLRGRSSICSTTFPCEESQDTVDSNTAETEFDPQEVELEELRKQFVGDADITEGSRRRRHYSDVSLIEFPSQIKSLFPESKRRFVLFLFNT